MDRDKSIVLATAAAGVALIAVVAMPITAHEQGPSSTTEPTPALLAEVRALRMAIEQSNAVAPRVQLTLTRLNIEEQRIAQLTIQLEQIRRQIADAVLESQKLSDRLGDVESSLQSPTEEKVRRTFEYEQRQLKRALRGQAALEQQLRASENDATQALNTEQARWNELNERLDELEALLAPVRRRQM